MKKNLLVVLTAAALIVSSVAYAAVNGSPVMRKQGKTYIVNTTTLCNTRGFRGSTPLEVYIKGNKVVKVVALKNSESPNFFGKVVKGLLPKMAGRNINKAASVDDVSGATFSSRAVKANVAAAVRYYQQHK